MRVGAGPRRSRSVRTAPGCRRHDAGCLTTATSDPISAFYALCRYAVSLAAGFSCTPSSPLVQEFKNTPRRDATPRRAREDSASRRRCDLRTAARRRGAPPQTRQISMAASPALAPTSSRSVKQVVTRSAARPSHIAAGSGREQWRNAHDIQLATLSPASRPLTAAASIGLAWACR